MTELLTKCLHLHQIRKELINIFMLIGERDKLLNNNINQFLGTKITNPMQQKYCESLIKTLTKLTKKLNKKIHQLTKNHPSIGNCFIINGKVFFII